MSKRKRLDLITTMCEDPDLSLRYQVLQLLGQGAFGKIVKAINIETLKTVALKIQNIKQTKAKVVLKNQANILNRLRNVVGVPKVYSYTNTKRWTYLQLEMFEHDLSQRHQFSLPEITELTLQMLDILQAIHSLNVIHQDIKPQNMMRSKQGNLILIDFGLSQISEQNRLPNFGGFVGTLRYASVRAHNMDQQYKSDDLQSLFYVIAYFYLQKLPWNNLNVIEDQKLERIKRSKLIHRKTLFHNFPQQFQKAFDYITNLEAKAQPNYTFLKNLFKRRRNFYINKLNPIAGHKNQLNNTVIGMNLLQIPEAELPMSKRQIIKTGHFSQNQTSCSNQLTNSTKSCQGNRSEFIISYFLQIFDDEDQKQSFSESSVQDQQINHFQSFHRRLILKNPFI